MLRQFSKAVSIYGLAPVFSKFVGFFLVPVYTRVFCPEEYGVIDLFNTLVHLFTVLINLQIYSAVGRYFEQAKDKKLLVSTALWNEILLSIVIVPPLIFFSFDINRLLLGHISYNRVFVLALVWMPLNVLSTYFSVVMRFENKPLVFVQVAILQTITKVAVTLVAILVLNIGVAGIYIGQIAGDILAVILYVVVLRKYIGVQADLYLLKKLLLFSVPLVPATFVVYGSDFLNRFIMLKYLSLSSIGIFAVGLKIASAFMIVSMAIRMAWEPFLYASLRRKDHKKQFLRIYKALAIVLFLLVCMVTLFSREILTIITTREYFEAQRIIGILSISFVLGILSQIAGIGPRVVHKTIYESVSRILGISMGALSMLLLVPLYGVVGAALAVCLGSGVSFILVWYYTENYYPVGYPRFFTLLIVMIMFFVVILNNAFAVALSLKLMGIAGFFVALFYYRKVLKRVIG